MTTPYPTAPHVPQAQGGSGAKKGCLFAGIGCAVTGLFAIVGLVAFFAFILFSGSGAEKAVEQHLALLKKGEVETAHAETAKAFRETTDLETYLAFVDRFPMLKDAESTSFKKQNFDISRQATLEGSITDSSGGSHPVRFICIMEGSGWKVGGLEFLEDSAASSASPDIAAPSPDDAKAAVEKHLALLKKDDPDAAYAGTAEDFRETTDLETYLAFVERFPMLKDVESTSFSKQSTAEEQTILEVSVVDSAGGSYPMQFICVIEEGETKIAGLSFLEDSSAQTAPAPGEPEPAPATESDFSVGTATIGIGRDDDGDIDDPGETIPAGSEKISADIEFSNYRRGETIHLWLERGSGEDAEVVVDTVEAQIDGEGNGVLTFDSDLDPSTLVPGVYSLIVLHNDETQFAFEFEVR